MRCRAPGSAAAAPLASTKRIAQGSELKGRRNALSATPWSPASCTAAPASGNRALLEEVDGAGGPAGAGSASAPGTCSPVTAGPSRSHPPSGAAPRAEEAVPPNRHRRGWHRLYLPGKALPETARLRRPLPERCPARPARRRVPAAGPEVGVVPSLKRWPLYSFRPSHQLQRLHLYPGRVPRFSFWEFQVWKKRGWRAWPGKVIERAEGDFTWPPHKKNLKVTPPEGHCSCGNTGSKRGALLRLTASPILPPSLPLFLVSI